MQSQDQDSQLFENVITKGMFAKTHSIIVLDLSGSQDMSIVRIGTVGLECTFAKPLEESVALIWLNKFETYREIITDGRVLLDLAQ